MYFLAFGIQNAVFGIWHLGKSRSWLYGPPPVFTFLNLVLSDILCNSMRSAIKDVVVIVCFAVFIIVD